MLARPACLIVLPVLFIFGGCASRPLPKYEKPIARSSVQSVRTTAYTHTESDHRKHGRSTALGSRLRYGNVRSAAADWSRWPAGTVFRILDTGELYEVDDYGWALSGTNTIDLYKPTRGAMNSWGVRRVNIAIYRWGDAWRSYEILKPRSKFAHVRRMVKQIEERYPRNASVPEPTANEVPIARAEAVPVRAAMPAPPLTTSTSSGFQQQGRSDVLKPFTTTRAIR